MGSLRYAVPGKLAAGFAESGKIRQGSSEFLVSHHIRHLEARVVAASHLLRSNPNDSELRRALVSHLVCRRIVGAKCRELTHEPSLYCRKNRVCEGCNFLNDRARAENLANSIKFSVQKRVHGIVFSVPHPHSWPELIDRTQGLLNVMPVLTDAMAAWKRKYVHLVGGYDASYVIGLHTKATNKSDFLWPHLHMVIVVPSTVPFDEKSPHCMLSCLKNAFIQSVPQVSNVVYQNKGLLGTKRLTKQQMQEQHRAKVMDQGDLIRFFAYATHQTERDDTAATISMRRRLFEELGFPTTFTRSRSSGDARTRKKRFQPCMFRPEELGHKSVYVFPFNGDLPYRIEPHQFDATVNSLKEQSSKLIANDFRDLDF